MRPLRETDVVRDYGRERFAALVVDAVLILKEDRRLTGLDRLRVALARQAAFRAIGGPARPFVPSRSVWKTGPPPFFCDELVAACALRLKLDGKVAA